jgi:signal transduction histidine kinase
MAVVLTPKGKLGSSNVCDLNLLQNAINHCPPETLITLGAFRDGPQVRLWVADTGPGIPVTERDKVFEMFYSVDPNRTKGGTGLGLALVKAITERLGGRITLSDATPGLRVDVLIPASDKKIIS